MSESLIKGWSWFCRNKVNLLFVILIGCSLAACVFYCVGDLNPLVHREYIIRCHENVEVKELLLKISKLEGIVTVLQRMIPIYGTLLVAVVLFLTWRQQETVKNAAIVEIHSTFKQHEERIISMEATAREKLEEIESHHIASQAMKGVTKKTLLEGISGMQDIIKNLDK